MKRKCNKCKQQKELDQFKFRSDNKYDCYCIPCRKEFQHQSYMKRQKEQTEKNKLYRKSKGYQKIKWYILFKQTLKCSNCPENHPACLEFHHKNPKEKSFNISSMIGRLSKKKILEEVKKCIVLCSNCHRKLHYKC